MVDKQEIHDTFGLPYNWSGGSSQEGITNTGLTGKHKSNDHLALIYDERDDQLETAAQFIQRGLAQDERCVYIVDDNTREDVRTALEKTEIDVAEAQESGALILLTAEDSYLRTGDFQTEVTLDFWQEQLQEATIDHSYAGLRVATEMSWALHTDTDLEHLASYESFQNPVYTGEGYIVLCQYNRDRFPDEILSEIIRTHPFIVSDQCVSENSRYTPPETFFTSDRSSSAPDQSAAGVDQLLDQLSTIDGETTLDTSPPPSQRDSRIQHIFKYAPDPIFIDDISANEILDVNEQACELLGYSYDELISLPISEIHPDAVSLCEEFLQSVSDEGILWTDRLPCVTKDGDRIPSEIAASTIHIDGKMCLITSVRPVETFAQSVEHIRNEEYSEAAPRTLETLLRTHEREVNRLTRLMYLIRKCHQSRLRAASRRGIERTVCSTLTDVDRYVFAWIGDYDTESETITPRAWSDTEAGFIEGRTIPVDDPPLGFGPVARAARTGETHVSQNIADDFAFEPVRKSALARGFESSAAIPLTWRGITYGILAVYADQVHTFTRKEETILDELGRELGAQIASLERKERLLTDEIARLEFETVNSGIFFVHVTDLLDCTFELDGVTRRSEDSLNIVCSMDVESVDSVTALQNQLPSVESVEHSNSSGDSTGSTTFEIGLRVDDTMLFDAIAEHGGVVREATAEGGNGIFTVELPLSSEIRSFVRMIQTRFPGTDLLAQHQLRQQRHATHVVERMRDFPLTDRQQEILERAYSEGYFETPRQQTAGDIAESLDISQPTFNQTLRRAHQNLLSTFFGDAEAE